jgi:polyhydroxyalkanoate synthase
MTRDAGADSRMKNDPSKPSSDTKASEGPGGAFEFMSAEQRSTLEQLSVNLAKAAMTLQSAFSAAAMRQVEAGPAVDPDPLHVGPAMGQVIGQLATQPDKLFRAQADLFDRYMELWRTTSARALGDSAEPAAAQPGDKPAAKPRGDKRFNAPEWTENPVFDAMKQSYLVTSTWLNELVSSVEGVDPMTKRRAEFFTRQLTDAFSPSNYLLSNPVALKAMTETQGESLVKGAEQFANDLMRGGGRLAISQTDFARFKVGENVATAPGKVVFQNDLLQLIQYAPTTKKVREIPLLIFPPWINKFYILDLKPENSMIRWLTSQGFTVFLASWVNPGPELANRTLDNYVLEGAYTAVAQVMAQCGAAHVNTVGYCIGGTMLGCALAHMASRDVEAVSSATFFAAQQDFAEAGDLLLFTDEPWLKDLEQRMDAAGGVLPGSAMADAFNMLRANDLIWSFFVNNYLMGKEPAAFDLLFWNADQTRMPKTLHLSYLRQFYQANRLARGELELGGAILNLKDVKIPVYVQASKEDHIAPMGSVYRGAKLFGGDTTFTLAGSGHIAGVINHPDANKYQHWTNPALPDTVEQWLAGAEEHKGSWWPHWAAWLHKLSGPMVAARDPAKGALPPIEDAPGSYVKVRSEAA